MVERKSRKGWVAVILLTLVAVGLILMTEKTVPIRKDAPVNFVEDAFHGFEKAALDMSRWIERQIAGIGESLKR